MIRPFLLSEVVLPDNHPRAGASCLVFGFVIHHAAGPVLVDTGIGTGHTQLDALYQPVHHPIDLVLAEMGVTSSDVRMIINTHLHFDHCGNNRKFPGVPLIVQRSEYEEAQVPGYTIPEWIGFPGAEWIPVDGPADILPGISLLPTPGHTPGHQSVLVTHATGIDVIAGQAVYDGGELDTERSIEPLSDWEAEQTSRSARSIKARNPVRVYFSHDADVWTSPRHETES